MNKIFISLLLTGSLLAQEDAQWIRESTLPLDEEARLFLKEMYTSPIQEEDCCQRKERLEQETTQINQAEANALSFSQSKDWEDNQLSSHPDNQLISKPRPQPESSSKTKTGQKSPEDFKKSHELCLVFVSFSLPLESWKEFSVFLEKTHGSFILRGIPDNSFPLFSKKIQELRKEGINASIEINPEAFEQYDIQAVPTLVLVSQSKSDKVTGNIFPEASLKMIEERGETSHFAKRLQDQLKKET